MTSDEHMDMFDDDQVDSNYDKFANIPVDP